MPSPIFSRRPIGPLLNFKTPDGRFSDGGIRMRDGYLGEPFWKQEENDSTYYNGRLDSQCVVPARSLREIKEELGLLSEENEQGTVKKLSLK